MAPTPASFQEVMDLEPVTAPTNLDRTLAVVPAEDQASDGGWDCLSQIGVEDTVEAWAMRRTFPPQRISLKTSGPTLGQEERVTPASPVVREASWASIKTSATVTALPFSSSPPPVSESRQIEAKASALL